MTGRGVAIGRITAAVAALSILLAVPTAASADPPARDSPDPSRFGTVVDRVVPRQLAEQDIPGAVVTVVAGGRTVFSKGYGTADLASGRPMRPDSTGSAAASEGKLFTATAALQLVRQGKLDLHTDVNRYLNDVTIPDSYPGRPVTLHHLLTYTSGFDYDVYGWSQWSSYAGMPSLAEFTAQVRPRRVRPPGEIAAYNNYDYLLIGRLIEIASGESYADYVAEHVFAPLGMRSTTAVQPQPQRLQSRLATGYRPDGDSQAEVARRVTPATPVGGGVVTTGPDMARFMIAQLQQSRSLGPGVARLMQREQFTPDPRIPGIGYGFEQRSRNGMRMLLKDGDLPGVHHNLVLIPGAGVGIHVAYNGDGVNQAAFWSAKELAHKIIDSSIAAPKTADPKPAAADVSDYAGSYADTRTSRTTFTKVGQLTAPITVTADGPGRLITTGLSEDPSVGEQRWVRVGPRLFRLNDGTETLAFGDDGTLASSQIPVAGYQKLSWYQTPGLHLGIVAGSALVLLAAFVLLPIRALVRAVRQRPGGPLPARIALVAAWISSLCVVLFAAGFAIVSADPNRLMAIPLTGDLTLSIALNTVSVMALTTIGVVLAAAVGWARRWWTVIGRLAYSVLAVAAIGFVSIAINYRLIGVPLTITI